MKKLLIILMLLFTFSLQAQSGVVLQELPTEEIAINYQAFGESYAKGLWQGSLGYATGMWLSGGRKGWGVVGSILAVNLPILLGNEFNDPEVWVGKNAGVLTVTVGVSFVITSKRGGKQNYQLHRLLRRY